MKLYCFFHIVLFVVIILIILYSNSIKNTKWIGYGIAFNDFTKLYHNNMKYVLRWTLDKASHPLVDMGNGQEGFIKRNCTYVNCFVTYDKRFLDTYLKFDAIVFHGPELLSRLRSDFINLFPKKRSIHQKYVFASIESASYYSLGSKVFDDYFNWTWTYKLDSDLRWGYIVIRDIEDNIIGPKTDMNWLKLEEMDPVTEEFKLRLKSKKKAAAWFASNCDSNNRREEFVDALRYELLIKYKHVLNIYGECGTYECSRQNEEICDKKVSEEYYFYLSFENDNSEDYVTEKLLRALKNNAVPVVYGGANYTRFMPDGIYLNALELGVKKLAAKMDELITDPDKYANYFKWKNHYKYDSTIASKETNEYCKMCELLNDEKAVKKITVYRDLQQWWDPTDTYRDLYRNKVQSALDN